MKSAVEHKLSLAEYRQLEEDTDTRYEYHDGEVFAMAGGSLEHSAIITNVLNMLGNLLPSDCRPFESNLKVYISSVKKGLYPGISVACRPVNHLREINAITNPVLLIEVLSDSTANYDRGDKFWFFSQLESLQEYVLIEQHSWKVETRHRSSVDKNWEMAYFAGENTDVTLRSLDISLPMNQIYQNIEDF